MIGEAAGECPIRSCGGTMVVEGHGVDERGRPVEWTVCDTCRKTVETVQPQVPADHPTLFGGG